MLNELLIAERGLARAGVPMTLRHTDIKDVRKGLPTLLVRLDADGGIVEVRAVPDEARPWTIGDGNHNRFPFVQPKSPFWQIPKDDPARTVITGRDTAARRTAILSLADTAQPDSSAAQLIGAKFAVRLNERSAVLSKNASNTFACRVAEAMRRFEKAAGLSADHARFARELSVALMHAIRHSADDQLVVIAAGLLVGRHDEEKDEVVAGAGLLFDAAPSDESSDDGHPIWHPDVAEAVNEAMQQEADSSTGSDKQVVALCALRGTESALLSGPFPNPNLPVLGPTLLFNRNSSTPSLARYGEFAATMPVGHGAASSLQAAAVALTLPHREGKTWRSIPGERPKQTDLLLAYVAAAPDAPVTEVVTKESELEHLATEVIDAVKARVGEAGLAETPVRMTILRRVDPGNRKAIANNTMSVSRLVDAARDWHAARRLHPPGLTLPVPENKKIEDLGPPFLAPLSLVRFTQPIYIRSGTERTNAVGITAAEALALFIDEGRTATLRASRILHLVLRRRTALIVGCAHARRRDFKDLSEFDRMEVLRTVTVLCVLLHKIGLQKETDMTDSPGYKFGQLLAAADAIHSGYCADVRGGQLPPSLLGNQVFATAQKSPMTAMAMLCRRWKPYGAWAKPFSNASERADKLIASKDKEDKDRAWNIRVALRHARDWKPLSAELATLLPDVQADDTYRAQLLLGYLAGLPKRERDDANDDNDNNNEGNR